MLHKYNNLELEHWRNQLMIEIRKKVEDDWAFPTSLFVLTQDMNSQLKVSIIYPKEKYTYEQLLEISNAYNSESCIALLLITQSSLPFEPKDPTLFSHFKSESFECSRYQTYQLYPSFKFFNEKIFKSSTF